jgi:hypothetical protein
MFTIKAGIKREKAPIISSYNNAFKMSIITTLKNILKYT